jgi:maltooligosyltrehalose synthase
MQVDVNVLMTGVISIIVAVLGSQWFASYMANHNSKNLKAEIEGIQASIKRITEEDEKREVKNARRRILRFNDELLNDQDIRHSKEYFDDVLDDITAYRRYTESHSEFPNGKVVLASENIERVYRRCMEKHDFL